ILIGDSVEVVGSLYGKNVVLLSGSMVYKKPVQVVEAFPPAPQIPIVTDTIGFFNTLIRQVTPEQESPTWTQTLPTTNSRQAYGAIGDAERQFAQKMNMEWYEIYGNHGQDGNGNPNALIMSLDPTVDPPTGQNIVRKVATIRSEER